MRRVIFQQHNAVSAAFHKRRGTGVFERAAAERSTVVMNIPKYRAWHKQRKKMMPVLQIDLDPDQGGVNVSREIGIRHIAQDFWPWSDIELMQCTGLQDEHKIEIYQGDIIQIMNCWSEKHLAHVVWDVSNPINTWDAGKTWMLHFFNGYAKDRNAPLYPYCQLRSGYGVTVIGNIYEQPELIKQQ